MAAYGLQTHIWSNNSKSLLLMAGFPVLLLLLTYGLFLLYRGVFRRELGPDPVAGPFLWAADALAQAWPFAIAGAILWFGIAYAFYQTMIDAATGARQVERKRRAAAVQFAGKSLHLARPQDAGAAHHGNRGHERLRHRAARGAIFRHGDARPDERAER